MWNNEIQQVMSKRELKFLNTTEDKLHISVNRTIMDYMDEYIKVKKLLNEIIAPINQMRSCKKLYLLCELIGMNGSEKTEYYLNKLDTSGIR